MHNPSPFSSFLIVAKALLNTVGVFSIPLIVVLISSMIFGASEVSQSYPIFFLISMIFIVPSFLSLLVSATTKVSRDIKHYKDLPVEQKSIGKVLFFFDSLGRHTSLLTMRGWGALIGGVIFILISMEIRWVSFGVTATFLILLLYLVLGMSTLVSAFMVRSFSSSIAQKRAGIHREVMPAVVLRGEVATERFILRRVPIPLGFVLLIEDKNPLVLETTSRYAASASAADGFITLQGAFRKTPRGLHKLGPASIWYQDALGLTRISVSSISMTSFKALPNVRPVDIQEAPQSSSEAPDILCTPNRFPTEDYFRFKEYYPGDDMRRIHWKLSIRTGQFQVRKPETKERTVESVLLVLDSYLVRDRFFSDLVEVEQILDGLIEVWLALANQLKQNGHRVQLVAVADDNKGNLSPNIVSCDKQVMMQWQDLGARIRWQNAYDIDRLAMEMEEGSHLVVVSGRVNSPPTLPESRSLTWAYLSPLDLLQEDNRTFWETLVGEGPGFWTRVLKQMLFLPYPTGTEDNMLLLQLRRYWWLRNQYYLRKNFRVLSKSVSKTTFAKIQQQSNSVYVIKEQGGIYRLIGQQGGRL